VPKSENAQNRRFAAHINGNLGHRNRVGLLRLGASKVRTKWSGALLSAHWACTLLAHFASQVRTLSMLLLAPFPSVQVGRKTQHLRPTCALHFLCWNHTCLFGRAFYCQLLLDSDLLIFFLPYCSTAHSLLPLPLAPPWGTCWFMSPPRLDHKDGKDNGSINPNSLGDRQKIE
jgi:hypothetical protein